MQQSFYNKFMSFFLAAAIIKFCCLFLQAAWGQGELRTLY